MENALRPSISCTRQYTKHAIWAERDARPVMLFDLRSWNRLSGEIPEALRVKGWIPQPLGAVKRHSNRCAYLPLPCSLSYSQLNSRRFGEVLACKLLKRMAPQVGLEPTTLRLTAGRIACRLLILKGLTADRRRQNRYAWGV